MGEFLARAVSIFWPLAWVLVCLLGTPTFANDTHEGVVVKEDFQAGEPPENFDEPQPSGNFIGNVPKNTKPNDYLLKNLKPADYPLEFVVLFMKVSQVFKKKVEAKESPNVTSQMAKEEVPRPEKTELFPGKWTASPPEAPARQPRTIDSRNLASVEESGHELDKPAVAKASSGKRPLISARPQAGPTKQLLESFKASQ